MEGFFATHGSSAGHSKSITDFLFSGEIIVTKDPASMRLWRARGDYALLRVVSCGGPHVAIHPSGQFIVTGTRGESGCGSDGSGDENTNPRKQTKAKTKIWGPGGGSAFSAGKKSITTGKFVTPA